MMNKDYRYQLESRKLTKKAVKKTACPSCGRKKCFVRYVDTRHGFGYVDNTVGKCDHQHSCGYHYTPHDYFRDHPDRQERRPSAVMLPPPPPPRPLEPLPMELVTRSHSPRSTFWQWLSGDCTRRLGLDPQVVQRVYENYLIGATRRSDVIFWQVDELGRVRSGHIMQYSPDGHRLGYQGWTHVSLIRKGCLPLDWQLYQCLYGQHLLPLRRQSHVCIVESEKTALVMACRHPDQLWLATCGSGGLSTEKLACLRGRRITIFPDSGCYEKWRKVMQQTTGIHYTITDQLEQYPPNTDLVDILLGEFKMEKCEKYGQTKRPP